MRATSVALLAASVLIPAAPGAASGPPPMSIYLRGPHDASMTAVAVPSGRVSVQPLPRLGGGDPPFTVAAVGGRLVYYARRAVGTAFTAAIAPGATRARSLGGSWYFVPSARPGRVWLALLDPRAADTDRRLAGVREVGVDGRPARRARHRPPAGMIVGAMREGLVISGAGLVVWDPVTGRTVWRPRGVLAAPPGRTALVSRTPGGRALLFARAARTSRGRIDPPAGYRFGTGGALSPDERTIAIPVVGRHGTRVAISDLGPRSRPLVAPAGGEGARLAWAPGGRWVVVAVPGRPLRAVDRGDGRVARLPSTAPARLADLVVAAP
ncbi:MAG: hypothetical protein AB7V42_15865 [Thermoleophilia bacterium]